MRCIRKRLRARARAHLCAPPSTLNGQAVATIRIQRGRQLQRIRIVVPAIHQVLFDELLPAEPTKDVDRPTCLPIAESTCSCFCFLSFHLTSPLYHHTCTPSLFFLQGLSHQERADKAGFHSLETLLCDSIVGGSDNAGAGGWMSAVDVMGSDAKVLEYNRIEALKRLYSKLLIEACAGGNEREV